MKKIRVFLMILICGLIFTTGCSKNKETINEEAMRFKEEYESLNGTIREKDGKTIRSITIDKENPIVYKEASDIVNAINNKETFVVYFGFTDCPWCRSVIPSMLEVAKNLAVKQIYYVNVKEIRDVLTLDEKNKVVESSKGSDAYYELLNLLDSVLEDYTLTSSTGKKVKTGEKRIYAPNVVAVKNGEVLQMTSGISELQTDGYQELTDEIKQEMYQKFECLMKCILEENSCSKEGC